MSTDIGNWRKKVTEVKLKSFNEPMFFGDKYIIGTARSTNCYTTTGVDKLVRKHSVHGRTQNLHMNSDRQTEQW